MAPSSPLRQHLEKLARDFEGAETLKASETLVLDAQSARTVLQTLRLLAQQAGHLELELGILRDSEAGKLIATTLEQSATNELSVMLDGASNNVVRPNFGGKSHESKS